MEPALHSSLKIYQEQAEPSHLDEGEEGVSLDKVICKNEAKD